MVHVVDLVARALLHGRSLDVLSVPIDARGSRLRGGIRNYPRWADIADELPLRVAVPPSSDVRFVQLLEEAEKTIIFIKASAKLRLARGSVEQIRDIVVGVWPEAAADENALADRLPPQNMLVNARVRFDLVMSLTMRSVWAWTRLYDPAAAMYMWIDGSPTSGFEAKIAWEMFQGIRTWQRLQLVNYLGFGHMGLQPKIYAILYKMWVECGDEELMRFRLALVKGIISDMGTEKDVADSRDVLPGILAFIGWDGFVERMDFLYPNAVWMSGWHHVFDHVAQWALVFFVRNMCF